MIRYIALFPVYLAVLIFGLLTGWIAAFFVDKEGDLPRGLSWYQTPDSNCFGADGDAGFRDSHAHWTGTWFGRWWVCAKWLFRNCMYVFSISMFVKR